MCVVIRNCLKANTNSNNQSVCVVDLSLLFDQPYCNIFAIYYIPLFLSLHFKFED